MKRVWSLGLVGMVAVSIIAAWFFIAAGRAAKTAGGVDPSATSSEQPSRGAEPGVKLTTERQRRIGIRIRKLVTRQYRRALTVYGQVLDPRPLLDLVKRYTDTQVRVSKAQAKLAASYPDYQRLKGLYAHNRNVSIKVYQHARAMWLLDRADLRSAQVSLQSALDRLEQAWGTKITQWARDNSAELRNLLGQDSRLVQLTLSAGVSLPTPPETAAITTVSGSRLPVQLVSPSPRTDPAIQGRSFFYLAKPPITTLPYGSSVIGHLPYGPRLEGVIVPESSVVWSQGRAWAYVQTDADQFLRHLIPTDNQIADSFFVRRGITAGDLIVVRGAQILFSEESLSASPSESGEGGEE